MNHPQIYQKWLAIGDWSDTMYCYEKLVTRCKAVTKYVVVQHPLPNIIILSVLKDEPSNSVMFISPKYDALLTPTCHRSGGRKGCFENSITVSFWNEDFEIKFNFFSTPSHILSYVHHLLFNPIPTEPEPAPQTRVAHFQQRHSHRLSGQLIASPSEISKRSPKESLQLEWNKTTATGAVPGSVWAISSPDQIALPRNGRVLAAFPVPRSLWSLWSLLQHCRRNCHIGSS